MDNKIINEKGVTAFLLHHASKKPASFHMPGHKGMEFYRRNGYGYIFEHMANLDITEIPGADNLFQTEGIIKETMDKYRELYRSKASYLLINGSSCGLIAAIMTAVPKGGKIIMARNCHKSVFNALQLGDFTPVYVYPEIEKTHRISGSLTPEDISKCLKEAPDASAVIVPSPNYYGICSDIKGIADIVHKAGKILIVDQAHGAHLKFFDEYIRREEPLAAENLGADIVIDSTHKTLASFTQSAVANLCSDRVSPALFEDRLQAIESTSPSYLLMSSLDINADILMAKGKTLIEEWQENLDRFYCAATEIEGLRIMDCPRLDRTKINLDMSLYGLTGRQLEEKLIETDIYPELVTGNLVMCMTGIGNTKEDYKRLFDRITEISSNYDIKDSEMMPSQEFTVKRSMQRAIPRFSERILATESFGRVCASSIIPYPPGIPLICPGEIIDRDVMCYAIEMRNKGENVMGIDGQGRVLVGKEEE